MLKKTGFDCPVAVELTQWAKILTKNRAAVPNLKTPSFSGIMESICTLRHTAVHRIPVSAAVVGQLLRSAADLAQALQDEARADLLQLMYQNVHSNFEETRTMSQALRDNFDRELNEIRRAREELNRREKEIIYTALNEHTERKRELGQRLEHIVGQTIAEWDKRGPKGLSKTREADAVIPAPLDDSASMAGAEAEIERNTPCESTTSPLKKPTTEA